jgi:tRNA(Ile)-lysidine synthase
MSEPRVLAAVSGGADSMALLLTLLDACPGGVRAAHFNHRLRDTADRDEVFVQAFCQSRGVPFFRGEADVKAEAQARRISVETAARELRYAFLRKTAREQGCGRIATGHTADDNAETVLLNVIRGAGLRGLGGIPPEREEFIRPLLGLTRRDVELFLAGRGVSYVHDESNDDPLYRRNNLRATVIPPCRALNPALSDSLLRLSAQARRDEDYLRAVSVSALQEGISVWSVHPAIASRVVRALYEQAGGDVRQLLECHVDAVLSLKRTGAKASLPGPLTAERTRNGTGLRIYNSLNSLGKPSDTIDGG